MFFKNNSIIFILVSVLTLVLLVSTVFGASIDNFDSTAKEIRVIASTSGSARVIIYEEDSDMIIISGSDDVDDVEPSASISKPSDSLPITGDNIEFSCGECDSADFQDAVVTIGGGGSFCGYSSQIPLLIVQNDDQLCARSTVTGIKYEFDLLSWAAHGNCWDDNGGDSCGDADNKVSYERTIAEQFLNEQLSGDDEFDINDIGFSSGDSYKLYIYDSNNNDVEEFDYSGEDLLVVQYPDQGTKLRFNNIEVKVNSKNDGGLQHKSDGYKISKKAELGDNVRVYVDVENIFTEISINNVDMKVTIFDIDDGDDLEEESDNEDIQAGGLKSLDVKFDELPERMDEDDYKLLIEVEGTDDNGELHRITKSFFLGVDLENKNLVLENIYLFPSAVSCDNFSELVLEIVNYGGKEEEDMRIVASSPALGFNFEKKKIDLDTGTDDDAELTLKIPINTSGVSEGTYTINVDIYRDEDNLEISDSITLEVKGCSDVDVLDVQQPIVQQSQQKVVVKTPESKKTVKETVVTGSVVKDEVKSSTNPLVILGIASLVLLVIASLLAVVVILIKG